MQRMRVVQSGIAVLVLAAGVFWIAAGPASGQAPAARISQTVVLDTEKFNVRRLTFPAGYRQQMHTVNADRDELVILITPGQFEGRVDAAVRVATRPGELWDVPKAPSLHAFANLGQEPVDILVVQRK
jgi:quercetin dioxygenase-like cupin family protein